MQVVEGKSKRVGKIVDGRPEKMRSQQEISANYNLKIGQYKSLFRQPSNSETHMQKLLMYNEIRLLGWVLGKTEQQVIKDSSL